MADGSPVRCGSIRRSIARPTSATSRCCWRAPRRPSSRATACKGAQAAVAAGAQRHRHGRRLPEPVAGQGFFRPRGRCAARHRQRPRHSRRTAARAARRAARSRAGADRGRRGRCGGRHGRGAQARAAGVRRAACARCRRSSRRSAAGACLPSPASAIRRNSLRRCARPASRSPRPGASTITIAIRGPTRRRCASEAERDGPRPGDDRKGSGAHAGRRRCRAARRAVARAAGDAGSSMTTPDFGSLLRERDRARPRGG